MSQAYNTQNTFRIQVEHFTASPDLSLTFHQYLRPDTGDDTENVHTFNLQAEDTEEFIGQFNPDRPGNENLGIIIKEEIGRGGMGVVYLGEQQLPERDVAVKRLIKPNSKLASALLHEAMTMGKLGHPNIIPIHSVSLDGELGPEVVMKRIAGESLDELIDKSGLTGDGLRKTLEILIQVCHALEFAHSQKIIHRDIKPSNIMLGEFGEVYLLDWGIAVRHDDAYINPTGLVGTPSYMAPEMLHGDPRSVDPRTDVYLMGATLHECITGQKRHIGATIKDALREADRSTPFSYPENIPSELASICNRACAREVEQRFEGIAALRQEIEFYLSRWEGIQLREVSYEKLRIFKDALLSTLSGPLIGSEIHRLFGETRFGFEQALRLTPDCQQSMEGLQECMEMMIQVLLKTGDISFAKNLVMNLPKPQPLLEDLVNQRLKESEDLVAKSSQLRDLEAQFDRGFSRDERFRVAMLLITSVIIVTSGAVIYDYIYKPPVTPQRLLITTGFVAISINLAILLGRKKLMANQIGRRLSLSIGGGSFFMVLVGLIGYSFKLDSNAIMLTHIVIVTMAFATSYPAIRIAGSICAWGFVIFLFCLYKHEWTHTLFLLYAITSSVGFLIDWIRESKA